MLPAGPQPEHLVVQHVGHPCQRVPVAGMPGGKGPGDRMERHAFLNMGIVVHIIIVVVIDKIKVKNLNIHRKCNDSKYQTQAEFDPGDAKNIFEHIFIFYEFKMLM